MATNPHTPADSPASGVPVLAIGFAPMPAVARVLAGFQREQLASFIEVAISLLDIADPDPDLEDNGDDELTGDEADAGWTEHHTRGRHKLASGMSEPFADREDDEDDDPDSCLAGDDRGTATFADDRDGLPGDPMDAEDGGDREQDYSDDEREQMPNDVPALPVYALDPNIFTDKRVFLGMNAAPSFIGDGPRCD